MVLQRSGFFHRLGCNGKTAFKGHHATPLHYLPAISYQFVCLIDFFLSSPLFIFFFFLKQSFISSKELSKAAVLLPL